MRVVVYPADNFGCGHFRMIWPGEAARAAGANVEVIRTQDRRVRVHMEGEHVRDVEVDADVVVFQRTTHRWVAQAVPVLRAKGVAVVVDVDDDLRSVHPSNPAFAGIHPKNARSKHSWRNLDAACQAATLVTVSTPALLPLYAAHGRGMVLRNYLPSSYDNLPRTDSGDLGWPASFHSHPNDPDALGGAVARLVGEGVPFRMIGDSTGAGRALGLSADPPGGGVPVDAWPGAVASLGVGMAPLADTRFNSAKSWLKPLEMSAAGVPWVASPRREYSRLHALGAGVLADRPRVWYRELKALHESAQRRRELSEAGRAVAAGLRMDDHGHLWAEAWQRAWDIQRGVPSPSVVA